MRVTVTMISGFAILSAVSLATLTACAASPESEAADSPFVCVQVRGPYCIQNVGLTIKEKHSEPGSGAVLTMYHDSWRENPVIIIEPPKCDARISDTAEVLDYKERYSWQGEDWDRMLVRLHSGGQCDFEFLIPDDSRDWRTRGFWAVLSGVRLCQTEQCAGPVLSQSIGDELRKLGHFPVGF